MMVASVWWGTPGARHGAGGSCCCPGDEGEGLSESWCRHAHPPNSPALSVSGTEGGRGGAGSSVPSGHWSSRLCPEQGPRLNSSAVAGAGTTLAPSRVDRLPILFLSATTTVLSFLTFFPFFFFF